MTDILPVVRNYFPGRRTPRAPSCVSPVRLIDGSGEPGGVPG